MSLFPSTQHTLRVPFSLREKKPPQPFPLDPLVPDHKTCYFHPTVVFLSPFSSERSRLSHQVTLLCALLSSSQVPSLSLCCRKKTCPLSLSQEVGHHGVPHTRTPDHAQGGMVSDLCMMGDVHPGGGSPPPARKSTAFMAPLISFQQPLVSTQWVEPCVQPLKIAIDPFFLFGFLLGCFPFLSLSCKNASFADKQKAEGPSQSLLYLLRALTGVPHCRKMFFRIFSPKFLKSKNVETQHKNKTTGIANCSF